MPNQYQEDSVSSNHIMERLQMLEQWKAASEVMIDQLDKTHKQVCTKLDSISTRLLQLERYIFMALGALVLLQVLVPTFLSKIH